MKHLAQSRSAPELVVVYKRSILGSAQFFDELEAQGGLKGPLSYLDSMITGKHGGSLVLSHVEADSAVDALITPLARRLPGSALLSSGAQNPNLAGFRYLADSASVCENVVLSSTRPTLVVVNLDGDDSRLAAVDKCLFEKSSNYLALFVTTVRSHQTTVRSTVHHQHVARMTNGTTVVPQQTYFPTYVWGWLFVVLFLIVFFLMAISSISSVQVPPKLLSAAQVAHKKHL